MNAKGATAANFKTPVVASADAGAHGRVETSWLVFRLGPHTMCASTLDVEGIIEPKPTTPLPFTPEHVLGTFMFRGRVATVISLRKKLRVADGEDSAKGPFIVARIGDELAAFWVDEVKDVLGEHRIAWQPMPDMLQSRVFDSYTIAEDVVILHTSFGSLLDASATGIPASWRSSVEGEAESSEARAAQSAGLESEDGRAPSPGPAPSPAAGATVGYLRTARDGARDDTTGADASHEEALESSPLRDAGTDAGEAEESPADATAEAAAPAAANAGEGGRIEGGEVDGPAAESAPAPSEPQEEISDAAHETGIPIAEGGAHDARAEPYEPVEEPAQEPSETAEEIEAAADETGLPIAEGGESYAPVEEAAQPPCEAGEQVAQAAEEPDLTAGWGQAPADATEAVAAESPATGDGFAHTADAHAIASLDAAEPATGAETPTPIDDSLQVPQGEPPAEDAGEAVLAGSPAGIDEADSRAARIPGAIVEQGRREQPDRRAPRPQGPDVARSTERSSPRSRALFGAALAAAIVLVAALVLWPDGRTRDPSTAQRADGRGPAAVAPVAPRRPSEPEPVRSDAKLPAREARGDISAASGTAARAEPPTRVATIETDEFSLTIERPAKPGALAPDSPGTDGTRTTAAAGQTAAAGVVHVVVRGDTLWQISRKYLGNPFRYPELARLSGIKNPNLIHPGDVVRMRVNEKRR